MLLPKAANILLAGAAALVEVALFAVAPLPPKLPKRLLVCAGCAVELEEVNKEKGDAEALDDGGLKAMVVDNQAC